MYGVPLPGHFRWSDGPIHILEEWFGSGHELEQNWSEVQARVDSEVGMWLRKWLSLKSRVEMCTVYIFPLIFYRLLLLPQANNHRLELQLFLSKLLWRSRRPMIRWQVCCQRPRNKSLGMPKMENHGFAERIAYMGQFLSKEHDVETKGEQQFFFASSQTPRLKVYVSWGVKHRLYSNAVRHFSTFMGPVTFFGLEMNCIWV